MFKKIICVSNKCLEVRSLKTLIKIKKHHYARILGFHNILLSWPSLGKMANNFYKFDFIILSLGKKSEVALLDLTS